MVKENLMRNLHVEGKAAFESRSHSLDQLQRSVANNVLDPRLGVPWPAVVHIKISGRFISTRVTIILGAMPEIPGAEPT